MVLVSVTYPRGTDATFDFDYYLQNHLSLLMKRWGNSGLQAVEALRGIAGADGGEPPFLAQALLRFSSMQSFQAALGGEYAPKIMGYIPNFTNA
ncbi:MAG: EthD family reductase [Pseudomonadota bacterium]|nr:EthD family reductase [Pseudomonadota bacterium]